jgi:hypothetical protein
LVWDTGGFAGLDQRHFPAQPFDDDVVGFVSVLRLVGCPTHIAGTVIPVAVDAVDRIFAARGFADIAKESLKAVQPFGTHLYPASDIPLGRSAADVFDAGFHLHPRIPFVSAAQAVSPPDLLTFDDIFSTALSL